MVALYALDVIAGFFQQQTRLLDGAYPTPFPVPFTAPVWHRVVPWTCAHLLHLARPVDPLHLVGRDSVYEYILRGTELVVAAAAAAIWSLLDRARRDYHTLDAYLRVLVRAALVTAILFYGLAKVPPAQFGVLTLYRRAQPVGDLWPMSMLWTFMAASPGYALLCGLVEVAGGLLLWRCTTGLGALVCVLAMTNVLDSFTLESTRESHLLDAPRWLSEGRRW